jgi:hypothetical protein
MKRQKANRKERSVNDEQTCEVFAVKNTIVYHHPTMPQRAGDGQYERRGE